MSKHLYSSIIEAFTNHGHSQTCTFAAILPDRVVRLWVELTQVILNHKSFPNLDLTPTQHLSLSID